VLRIHQNPLADAAVLRYNRGDDPYLLCRPLQKGNTMSARIALSSLLLLAAGAGPAFAQVNMQWKLKEGDKFYLEEKIVGKIEVKAMGVSNSEEHSQTRLSSFVVKGRARDGFVLEQRIESWKTKMSAPGEDDANKLLDQLFKDVVFTIHLSPSGAVTRFDGFDQIVKKLAAIDPAEAKKFKALVNEELMRAPLSMVFDVLPTSPVKKGESWKRENVVPMGPMGTFKFASTYTYQATDKSREEIGTKSILTWQPPRGDAGDIGFKIVKMDLSRKEASGRLVFDSAKGRLVQQETTMPLAGTMTIEVQGMQVDVELDGTETRTMRISDKKPAPEI
jgi:hypothetical protein